MGSVLSNYKMTTYIGSIHLLNPFLRLMVVTMGYMLIILSNVTLSDAKIMEGHFNATLDAAALIEKNRIPLLNTKWDNSLCPKHLDKCQADSESRQVCFNPCDNGYDYECVTSDRYEYGMEFCLDKKKTLDKGRQLRAIPLPQYNSVYPREEQCPAGTYKPERAPVFVSCAEHNPPPPHFIILTPGTTTAPPMGYCDWKNGYFNLDHYNYWYTNETYVTTCVHRSEHTYLCTLDYDILPNGTCSVRCVSGERDVSQQFVCINGTITDSFSTSFVKPTVPNLQTKQPFTTTAIPVLASQINPEVKSTGHHIDYTAIYVAVPVTVVVVVCCATIVVVVALYLRRHRQSTSTKTCHNVEGNYVSIGHRSTVTFNSNTNDARVPIEDNASEHSATSLFSHPDARAPEQDDDQRIELLKDVDGSETVQEDGGTDPDETEFKKIHTTHQEC